MSRRVIAVLDWKAAAALKENATLFERAAAGGKVKYRSLIVWEDGSCELQRLSTVAVARRLGGTIARKTARKVRMDQRG